MSCGKLSNGRGWQPWRLQLPGAVTARTFPNSCFYGLWQQVEGSQLPSIGEVLIVLLVKVKVLVLTTLTHDPCLVENLSYIECIGAAGDSMPFLAG